MDAWELALLAVAAYVSVMTLVRMMRRRRDRIVEQLTQETEAARKRLQLEKRNEERTKLQEETIRKRLQRREAA